MNVESLQSALAVPATSDASPVTPAATQGTPAETRAGTLHARRRDIVSMVGLRARYVDAIQNNHRFLGEVQQLLDDNRIPLKDKTAVQIVSKLHFLSGITADALGPETAHAMRSVRQYAQTTLDNFLSVYRSHVTSDGTNPPGFVLANARNDALFMTQKYFGIPDIVFPNVTPREREPLKGEVCL